MGTLFYLTCLVIGFALGYLTTKSMKTKCNHKWKLIDSGQVWRGNVNKIRGCVKVYECEHCLKMRKEQIDVI